MSNSVFHNFDSTFSIVGDDVTSDVWLTVRSINYDSIIRALFNLIPPNQGHGPGPIVVTYYLNTILMRL